jgi:acyl-CoA synthetase (AMP-forming)/AMP-acid ligase II
MIHHFLENSAARYPDKIAVIHDGQRVTYQQINHWASNLAAFLQKNGVGQGDRVALLMENGVDYIVSYYGILKSGAAAVPLNSGLKPDGLKYLLDDLEPVVIITNHKSERLLKACPLNDTLRLLVIKNPKLQYDETSFGIFPFEKIIADQSNQSALVETSNTDALASIIYTSGSTGKPKGVMLSHGNIVSNTMSICDYLNLNHTDIQMVVLPFFYVMGKSLLNTHFAVGGTIVINNRFLYPADVIKQMAEEHVTGFSGVPSTYAYLLHRSPLSNFKDQLKFLRYCSQAGGHMATQLKKDLRSALPDHTKIVIMYGATEASARLSYLEPEQFDRKMGSIGKAIPGVELQIVDDAGLVVENGAAGELLAKGPNIMKGYWKDPESTKLAIDKNGFYHTGDIAYKDQDGYFYITGRKDNILKVGGHKVNPQEIEECLMRTKQLIEVAVIGVPDHFNGHRLIALYVPLDNRIIKTDLEKYCNQMMLSHQVPTEFVFVKTLPKNGTGKVDIKQCLLTYHNIKLNYSSM